MLDKSQKFAELKIDEKSIKVLISRGTLGPDVLDIRSLYKETIIHFKKTFDIETDKRAPKVVLRIYQTL